MAFNNIYPVQLIIIDSAEKFAIEVHGDQKYGKKPYREHLEGVVNNLKKFGFKEIQDYKLFCAAWLHDTLEDTPISKFQLESQFGKEIADIVDSVTDVVNNAPRKERKALTYPKIKASREGTIVKLADRIANAEYSKTVGGKYYQMYKDEHKEFKDYLFDGNNLEMWNYLDKIFLTPVSE
jgi:(p)ppGpp synthase/HD superfamily hydrolase